MRAMGTGGDRFVRATTSSGEGREKGRSFNLGAARRFLTG
jgi:hypothetical protein